MPQVTLIGKRLAIVGTQFVYEGETDGCDGCPYRGQCLNLTEGRRYQVTDVRDSGTLDCAVHDSGVRAVEVEPAPIVANIDSNSAYLGSKARLEGPCPYTNCPSHEFCEPVGADTSSEFQITEVLGDPPHDYCMLERELTLVEFAPPSDSQS